MGLPYSFGGDFVCDLDGGFSGRVWWWVWWLVWWWILRCRFGWRQPKWLIWWVTKRWGKCVLELVLCDGIVLVLRFLAGYVFVTGMFECGLLIIFVCYWHWQGWWWQMCGFHGLWNSWHRWSCICVLVFVFFVPCCSVRSVSPGLITHLIFELELGLRRSFLCPIVL